MARTKKKSSAAQNIGKKISESIHPDIKRIILRVAFFVVTIILLLAGFGQAGPWGEWLYGTLSYLFGWGYFFFPVISLLFGVSLTSEKDEDERFFLTSVIAGFLFVISGLGVIDIIAPDSGGVLGQFIGGLESPFGTPVSLIITFAILLASLLVMVNRPLNLRLPKLPRREETDEEEYEEEVIEPDIPEEYEDEEDAEEEEEMEEPQEYKEPKFFKKKGKMKPIKNYVPPPLSLLSSSVDKPTVGDLRANANVIKRTLDSFGIPVEMGEIHVGPTVTRYTLKPAEGVRLSRITALHQDLALALAAHPIRIEAPIPGKSLVGIEVPNKAAAVVRLGSIIRYPDFQSANPLTFAIGRNVSGEPVFKDISKMPHLLVAGATGSGKSITIHSLIISLLYKNSPDMLRFVMVDPKRVELSTYSGIPHLLSPVITENKKALGALRWAIQEMDRRYQLLLESGSRDIKSYHKQHKDLPYIVIIIDELADIMSSYGREVEGSIIRLAQMARATGIHLVVSTQRPSVEVITGLIKANITTRIALQVASQIDSRTILDSSGAEKLLGSGDLLLTSAELSKPVRIQGSFITEDEIKSVVSFIKENNEVPHEEEEELSEDELEKAGDDAEEGPSLNFEEYADGEDAEDELYDEAVSIVREAGKASASFLQRRLKIGYARAARLLDIMEDKGVVGPGEGAKPREVYGDN